MSAITLDLLNKSVPIFNEKDVIICIKRKNCKKINKLTKKYELKSAFEM